MCVARPELMRGAGSPLMVSVPDVGSSSRPRMFSNVDLPEPEGPMTAMTSARPSVRSRPSSTTRGPKLFPSFLATSGAALVAPAAVLPLEMPAAAMGVVAVVAILYSFSMRLSCFRLFART